MVALAAMITFTPLSAPSTTSSEVRGQATQDQGAVMGMTKAA
jgi:hypothetical protein